MTWIARFLAWLGGLYRADPTIGIGSINRPRIDALDDERCAHDSGVYYLDEEQYADFMKNMTEPREPTEKIKEAGRRIREFHRTGKWPQ